MKALIISIYWRIICIFIRTVYGSVRSSQGIIVRQLKCVAEILVDCAVINFPFFFFQFPCLNLQDQLGDNLAPIH